MGMTITQRELLKIYHDRKRKEHGKKEGEKNHNTNSFPQSLLIPPSPSLSLNSSQLSRSVRNKRDVHVKYLWPVEEISRPGARSSSGILFTNSSNREKKRRIGVGVMPHSQHYLSK